MENEDRRDEFTPQNEQNNHPAPPFPITNDWGFSAPLTPSPFECSRAILSSCLGIVCIMLITVAAQYLLQIPILLFCPEIVEEPWFITVFSSVPMYAIAMPLSYLVFRLGKADPPVPRGKVNFWAFLALLAICFGLTMAGNIISNIVQSIVYAVTGIPPENVVQTMASASPFWANLIFMGILGPVMEEIFLRKLVIDRLRLFGELPAIVISGLLFGVTHGNFSQIFYASLFGILAGFIYVYTGKIGYTIALHITLNCIGGVFSTELFKYIDRMGLSEANLLELLANPAALIPYLLYSGLLLLCTVLTPIFIGLLWKYTRVEKMSTLPTGELVLRFLKHPAFWVYCAMVVFMFLF